MSTFTEEQIQAIEWFKGPLLVIGTPGSGKTTVIVNRINNLICGHRVAPENILVITFTKAAAFSMRQRFLELCDIEDTRVRFGTFHSFFYWIIRTAYGGSSDLKVLDEAEKRSVIQELLCQINKDAYDNDETISSLINQFGIISSDLIDVANYYSTDMSVDDFRLVYNRYQEYKTSNGLIDFDDMVSMCYKLLVERKDILERIRMMYPYIMVDEFQDTNRIQYEILKMISHPLDNLYAVGDDDQSIYGFRGARPDIMLSFSREFKDANIIHLSDNFRCPSAIVDVSSSIIQQNTKRYEKVLKSKTDRKGSFDIYSVHDVRDENELICRGILHAEINGVKPEEIAVLYRTNLGPRRLLYKLREYNIDFSIRDTVPDIFSNASVAAVVNYISFALGNHSRDIFLTFMNKPVRYISRNMLDETEVDLDKLIDSVDDDKDYLRNNLRRLKSELRTISSLSPYAAVNYIREAIGYNTYIKKYAEEKNIQCDEIIDILDEFQSMTKDLKTFDDFYDMIDEYREMLKLQSEHGAYHSSGVQLMTLHSAKGLEFKEVHIMDVIEDVIPHKRSKSTSEIEEERRMLYVGVTRSSDKLFIYMPRIMGEKIGKPSRFIDGLPISEIAQIK